MQHRSLKPFWLFLALLFAGQSLLPLAAFAEVSVRCVGAPASSKPCAQGVFAVPGRADIAKRFEVLPCCRHMTGCPTMARCLQTAAAANLRGSAAALPARAFFWFAPKCLVSIRLLNTKPASLASQSPRRLFQSSPALAPPVLPTAPVALIIAITAFIPNTINLPASLSTHSHGLRAPPCA